MFAEKPLEPRAETVKRIRAPKSQAEVLAALEAELEAAAAEGGAFGAGAAREHSQCWSWETFLTPLPPGVEPPPEPPPREQVTCGLCDQVVMEQFLECGCAGPASVWKLCTKCETVYQGACSCTDGAGGC